MNWLPAFVISPPRPVEVSGAGAASVCCVWLTILPIPAGSYRHEESKLEGYQQAATATNHEYLRAASVCPTGWRSPARSRAQRGPRREQRPS